MRTALIALVASCGGNYLLLGGVATVVQFQIIGLIWTFCLKRDNYWANLG